MTTKAQAARDTAREELRAILKPGDTVWTVLRHVSRSGMSHDIDAYVLTSDENGECDRRWLSHLVAKAGVGHWNGRRKAMTMGGCGMDMGFALVYELSCALWPKGFQCIGERCDANDHLNPPRPPRIKQYTSETCPGRPCGDCCDHTGVNDIWHNNGGYALRQRWL